jgi:hypothetical protein
MPRKFILGLGALAPAALSANVGGVQATILTGSILNGITSVLSTNNSQIVTQLGSSAGNQTQNAVSSESSTTAYHSTLFEDFGVEATPTYNFYTPDEQTNAQANPSASLADLPRYVTVTWNPTPVQRILTPAVKGVRSYGGHGPVLPAIPISTAKRSVSNGYVSPGAVQALLVPPVQAPTPPTFSEDLFLADPTAGGLSAAAAIDSGSLYHTPAVTPPSLRIRVNFVDPSIAGALNSNRIAVATDQVHLTSLGSLSKLMGGLEVISEFNQDVPLRNPIPKFPTPTQTPGLAYVGYVLERYTLDVSGSMTLTKTVDLDDATDDNYVDREVTYGANYTYRIRTVVQWTHAANVDFPGSSSLVLLPAFDTSAGSNGQQSSFYAGQWSDWSRVQVLDTSTPSYPDEFTVRPVSPLGQVHVSWKMPADPQQDLSSLYLLRATLVRGRLSDWVQVGQFVPGNGLYVDSHVAPFEESHTSYVYSMYSVSYHGAFSTLCEKVQVRLTDRYKYIGEEPLVLLGPAGDDPFDPASGAAPPPVTELVAASRAVFYVRGASSTLPLFGRTYTVEIQSLSTGERAEVTLEVDTTDVDQVPAPSTPTPVVAVGRSPST